MWSNVAPSHTLLSTILFHIIYKYFATSICRNGSVCESLLRRLVHAVTTNTFTCTWRSSTVGVDGITVCGWFIGTRWSAGTRPEGRSSSSKRGRRSGLATPSRYSRCRCWGWTILLKSLFLKTSLFKSLYFINNLITMIIKQTKTRRISITFNKLLIAIMYINRVVEERITQ